MAWGSRTGVLGYGIAEGGLRAGSWVFLTVGGPWGGAAEPPGRWRSETDDMTESGCPVAGEGKRGVQL